MIPTRTALLLIASAFCLAGCGKRANTEKGQVQSTNTAPAQPLQATAPNAPTKVHGARKMQNVDVPVWVDGKQAAVLRYGELPSTVKAHPPAGDEAGQTRYYRVDEYLKAIGVPVERVRAIHMLGNRDKVASIEGDELRAEKERFVFDFMQETTGIARTHWDTTGLKNLYRIDEIRALSVYVDKAAPRIDPSLQCHLRTGANAGTNATPEEACAADDPYATNERAKGTRVYSDGRLAGYVKRRLIPDSVIDGKDEAGEYRFSLDKFMATLRVDPSSAQAIELVSEDDVIARIGPADWKKSHFTFALPRHQHGRVRIRIPAALQARGAPPLAAADLMGGPQDREATVTAVLVHRLSPPTARALAPIEEEAPEGNPLAARDDGE